MTKQKTHKASKKRFKISGTGKLLRTQAGKKHLNSHKSGKRKRHLRAKVSRVPRKSPRLVLMANGVALGLCSALCCACFVQHVDCLVR